MTLRTERQSARMSKITNDGLTRSAGHRMLYSYLSKQVAAILYQR